MSTPAALPAYLAAAYAGVVEALRAQGACYSPEDLVAERAEHVREDLADGMDYACAKVPSGSEVTIPAELARWLLAQSARSGRTGRAAAWGRSR